MVCCGEGRKYELGSEVASFFYSLSLSFTNVANLLECGGVALVHSVQFHLTLSLCTCKYLSTGFSKKRRLGCVNLPLALWRVHATKLTIFGQLCNIRQFGLKLFNLIFATCFDLMMQPSIHHLPTLIIYVTSELPCHKRLPVSPPHPLLSLLRDVVCHER